MIAESSVLILDRYNQLKTISQFQTQLNQYITGALIQLDTNLSDVGGVIALKEHEDNQPLMLTIVPFSYVPDCGEYRGQEQKVAIFMTDPSQSHHLAVSYLKQVYGLSLRELEICERFINVSDIAEIAQHCGITLSTTRTYLKHIFAKTQWVILP